MRHRLSAVLLRLLLSIGLVAGTLACTQIRESAPERTATEQLLFARAVERVCDALAIEIPEDSKVFVDDRFVEGTDSLYLVASLRDTLLRHGAALVASRAEADLVFEPRVGAISTDRRQTFVGLPSFVIPIPLTGDVATPELTLFKKNRHQGVVKLALTSYDAETGTLHQSLKPAYGYSHRTDWVALFFLKWQDNDLIPDPQNDPWIGEGTFD